MLPTIQQKLRELEATHQIRILYACESGSRAWGFPSPDSDYDVRFIYARAIIDYLNIIEVKDVIDLPVNEVLDIGGWDIKKALKLFLKSNSGLFEWLQSPVVYMDDYGFAGELRHLMPKYFSPKGAGSHYFSLVLNTVNNDLQGEQFKLKRYFYALRSLLACKWITDKQTLPPMEFEKLRVLVDDVAFQTTIDELLTIKQGSDEKTLIAPIPLLDEWLAETLAACRSALAELTSQHKPVDELNEVFRKYILR